MVPKIRLQTVLALFVLGVGLVVAFVVGLFAWVSLTAPTLHPDAAAVKSVAHAAPAAKWAGTVEQGRQVVRTALKEQNLPGLSVAVGLGGEIVWAEGFGWADLEHQEPVAPDMKFRLGTASKVLTSAAVGLLLERNRMKLEDEIQTYVPEFPKKQWPVTVRHLMAHLAGVRNDGGDEGPFYSKHCERTVDALPTFAGQELLFEPGTRYRYSNYGWILVSAAVEAAADERLLTFMRTQIFEPLAMQDTRAESTETVSKRATFYFPRFAADPKYGYHAMRQIDLSCYSGSSVLLSTPSDLVRFAMAIDNGKLLKAETVQLLQTSQRLPSGEETGYGLGWDLETATLSGAQTRVVGHDGEVLGGTVASLMTFPEHRIVVAVMSNIPYADTFAVGSKIAEAFVEQR